jgi:hypothetical protein
VYFNYRENAATVDILGNLLKQLLEEAGALSDEIQDFHTNHHQRVPKPNLKDVIKLIDNEASRVSTFFIVLDAIDECTGGEDAAAKILVELQRIPNARLMITGRPHFESTVSRLKEFKTLKIRARDEDIAKSIDSWIEESVFLCDCIDNDDSLRDVIVGAVVEKAQGMYAQIHCSSVANGFRFLLAQLHLEFLGTRLTQKKTTHSLDTAAGRPKQHLRKCPGTNPSSTQKPV